MARELESDFEDAEASPGLMLWRVTNTWQARMRAALRPFDLTHVQFVLLASLVWMQSDKPITQRDLAGQARTDPMMTSQVLRTLEAKGLIRRLPHPEDARARALVATTEGVAAANRAIAAVEAADREFFGPLTTTRADFLAQLTALDAGDS
jgi:DNA-binding MarR family transcriptional regulator